MKHILIACMLLFCSICAVHAQKTLSFAEATKVFGGQKIIEFRRFTLYPTDNGQKELDVLKGILDAYPEVIKHNVLIIQAFTCEEELNVKPYLGVCRAYKVAEFLASSLGIPRRKCFIQYKGKEHFDKDCIAGSGINIYLKEEKKR